MDPSKRIAGHMNKDHQLALVDYVVAYGGEKISQISPKSVEITSVETEKMELSYKSSSKEDKQLTIVWNETEDGEGLKVHSMQDIKAKLIAMAKYAAAKQGFSHVQIKKILMPDSFGSYVAYAFGILSILTYYKKDVVRSVFELFVSVQSHELNTILNFLENYVLTIAVATYAIHVLEMIFITWPRCVKYRMPTQTALAWLGFTFAEGFFQNRRFKSLVQ